MAVVTLWNRELGVAEEAELFDNVSLLDFNEAQDKWRPTLREAAEKLREAGEGVPAYVHWDWRQKSRLLGRLDVTFYGIRCSGLLQGLMMVDAGTMERCRVQDDKGKELIYVDYVETAPWNIPEYMAALEREAKYSRVGTRLMQAAVQLSLDSELKGRVGLHSLPRAESFYGKLGMTAVGRDAKKQNLLWLEFTPSAANEFMETYK